MTESASVNGNGVNIYGPNGVHSSASTLPSEYQEPIAICGIGCEFSGGSDDASSLWKMLEEKRTGRCRIPSSRLNIDSFYHPSKGRPGSMQIDTGYFLHEDPRNFEPSFFGIRPEEAATIDPQQRKLMEVVYKAFESAGVTLEDVAGSNTGCYVGSFKPWEYSVLLSHDPEYPAPYSFTGGTMALMSNRLSYIFDMTGPSFVLDTGCSSSLYAMHLACTAIAGGECTAAVVCGVSVLLSIESFIDAARVGFLSKDAVCHTFDSEANGFARGEGVAAVYLKKLSDAVRDGDPIRAVIRSTAVNANGRTAGITHPSVLGQEQVIKEAYRRAGGLRPDDTSYFECHGTGTPIGDPIEISAIKNVFAKSRKASDPLRIGSVKTNLGHTEPTAGLAGLLRIVLSMENDLIPATLGVKNLNPAIDFDGAKVKVVLENEPWPSSSVRRASLNSFGYGGANAHAIIESGTSMLENHPPTYTFRKSVPRLKGVNGGSTNGVNGDTLTNGVNGHAPANGVNGSSTNGVNGSSGPTPCYLLTFSAHRDQNLFRNIEEIQKVAGSYDLRDLAYTLNEKRSRFFSRAYAIVDKNTITEALNPPKIVSGQASGQSPNLAFAFTGQGAQWLGMAAGLMESFPRFEETIDELDEVLRALGEDAPDWSIKQQLQDADNLFSEAAVTQPVCTAIQIALVNLFDSWGIRPTATIGHSSGEIAAAFTSGFISAEDAITAAYYRGILSTELGRKYQAAMAAVGLGALESQPFLEEAAQGEILTVACVNSKTSTTISGSEAAIDRLYTILVGKGIFVRKLSTGGCAYHSTYMADIGETYETALIRNSSKTQPKPSRRPLIPMFSSLTGKAIVKDSHYMIDAGYWRKNLESPVLFATAFSSLLNSKECETDIVIELGPHSALSGAIKETTVDIRPDGPAVLYLPSLLRGKNGEQCLKRLAGNLFVAGHNVDLAAVNHARRESLTLSNDGAHGHYEKPKIVVDLPAYKWDYTEKYWHESRLSTEFRFREQPRHDLLGSRMPGSTDSDWLFRNILRSKDLPWLQDHRVGSTIVLPASGMIAMVIEAATQVIEAAASRQTRPIEIAGYTLRNFFINNTIQIPADDDDGAGGGGGVETILSFRRVAFTGSQYAKTKFEFNIRSLRVSNDSSGFVDKKTSVHQAEDSWSDNAIGQITVETHPRRHINLFDANQGVWVDVPPESFRRYCTSAGLNYTGSFTGLSSVRACPTEMRATASVPMRPTDGMMTGESRYAIHPATMDLCFQTIVAAVNSRPSATRARGYLPVSIEELTVRARASELSPSRSLSRVDVELVGRRTCAADIQLCAPNGEILLHATKFNCLAIESSDQQTNNVATATHNMPYAREVWGVSIDGLNQAQAEKLFPAIQDPGAVESSNTVGRFSLLCLKNIVEDYPHFPATSRVKDAQNSNHMAYYYRYLVSQARGDGPSEVALSLMQSVQSMTREQRKAEIETTSQVKASNPYIRAIYRIYSNMGDILSGKTASIDLLTTDSTLSDIYDGTKTPAMAGALTQLRNIVDLLGHKTPGMNILEVGAGTGSATRVVLDTLSSAAANSTSSAGTGRGRRRYGTFTFTDISAGFFPEAEQAFKAYKNIEYKTLNIEADPQTQGYKEHSYDVIIISNVIHATDAQKSFETLRRLLKPDGRLVLLESTHEPLGVGILFGTLPGWWTNVERGRELSALISRDKWQKLLEFEGFSMQVALDDYQQPDNISTVMVATRSYSNPSKSNGDASIGAALESKCPTITDSVSILYRRKPHSLYHALYQVLAESGYNPSGIPLGEYDPQSNNGSAVICLADLEDPFLQDINEAELVSMKSFTNQAPFALWITCCGIMTGEIPEHAPTWGLVRALRSELSSAQYILDLEPGASTSQNPDHHQLAKIVSSLFDRLNNTQQQSADQEFALRNGVLRTNRLVAADDANAWSVAKSTDAKVMQKFSESPSLRLNIEDIGMFDTLYFDEEDQIYRDLPPDYVEVRAKAFGMNMKEVLSLMGKVDQKVIAEGSGIVTRVGSAVTTLKPGDKVCGFSNSDYGTYMYASEKLMAKFPDGFSFEEMAATSTVYCTVFECLINIGRLKKGENLLVHAAAGGVGVAAIELARLLGAEIYCTVGSQAKREFLIEHLGIPPDRIFSSRDTSFYDDVMHATSGKGIDVTLNSTAHELLHETVRLLRQGGRHIEIGKVDIWGNGKLDMREFQRALTFAHVDLAAHPIDDIAVLLSDVMEAIASRKIRPPRPIKRFALSDVESACRYFMEGRHMGKVVLTCDADAVSDNSQLVKVLPSRRLLLKQNVTYFLVGCLGGLGRALVGWMASRGAKHFLMLSRSGIDRPEAATMVSELSATHGINIKVVRGDVSHKADVERAVNSAEPEYPIRGVIQAAMVLEDSIFAMSSTAGLRKVMTPKVQGTRNLCQGFNSGSERPLDFFVCTSSISAVLGIPSQSSYDAANLYLEAAMKNRVRHGLHGAAVAITMVKSVGILSENPELREKATAHGLYEMGPEEFLEAMEYAMQPQGREVENSVLITGLDVKRLVEEKSGAGTSVFDPDGPWGNEARLAGLVAAADDVIKGSTLTGAEEVAVSLLKEITDAISTEGPEAGLAVLIKAFRTKLSKTLLAPIERIDVEKKVSEYGMDSMAGAEIRRWFSKVLGVDFSFLILLSPVMTIRNLAERAFSDIQNNNAGVVTK